MARGESEEESVRSVMDMPRVAVMGAGMVGGALGRYFESRDIPTGWFDPPKGLVDVNVLRNADVIFVAVPTPYYLDGSGFDDSFLRAACDAIPVGGKTIVIKSTVLPGTTERFQSLYPQHRVLFNPEFLTEAHADEDMRTPDRQILGITAQSASDANVVMALLPRAPFERVMTAKDAEMVKYFGNAFLAAKVTFANQLFDLCEQVGCEYERVQEAAAADPRIGKSHLQIFHNGYRGYGGKCLPKDVRSLVQLAESLGVDMSLLKIAETYNNQLCQSQGIEIQWREGSPNKT